MGFFVVFFLKLNKTTNILCFLTFFFFFFFGYGKFGSHGLFAIYWISGNNGLRCIGAALYYFGLVEPRHFSRAGLFISY